MSGGVDRIEADQIFAFINSDQVNMKLLIEAALPSARADFTK
jgi:hypothetical protein